MASHPTIYLLPTPLDPKYKTDQLGPFKLELIKKASLIIGESYKSIKRLTYQQPGNKELSIKIFNVKNKKKELDYIKEEIMKKRGIVLLISDGGSPCVADPGQEIVFWAHQQNIPVTPLPGSNSIVQALAASGLNGQQFTFHGYLPIKEPDLDKKLSIIFRQLKHTNYSQIFMETPYRNKKLLQKVIHNGQKSTIKEVFLTIATNLEKENQFISTQPLSYYAKNYKKIAKQIDHQPTIFILGFPS